MVWKSQNKVTSYVSCLNVPVKYYHLEGLSKAHLVKFEAVEDIINNISAGTGQHRNYLQTIYKKHLKTSVNMIVTKILYRNRVKTVQPTSIPSKNHQKIKIS